MGFSTERTDALWWLMISADSNAVRALLTLLDRPPGARTCRAWCAARSAGSSAGTGTRRLANAWGVLAMEKFSAAFESDPGHRAHDSSTTAPATRDRSPGRRERRIAASSFRGRTGRRTLRLAHAGAGRPWVIVRKPRRAAARCAAVRPDSRSRARVTPVEQATRRALDARRRRARAPRDRRAVRHELGGGRRSGARPARPARQRARRTVAAAHGEASGAKAGCGRRSRSGASTPSAPTTASCRRALRRRVHGPAQQPGHVPAAGDARRGDVRAGDARRAAEPARSTVRSAP